MDAKVEIYKAYLEDLGRIGERHQNVRTFYVSVISALFVFLAMAGPNGLLANVQGKVLVVVGLAGILICAAWYTHMGSFGAIYRAKLKTLRSLETAGGLPLQPFTEETKLLLRPGKVAPQAAEPSPEPEFAYPKIASVDGFTPLGSALLFIGLIVLKFF
jgi:hypothetical protein